MAPRAGEERARRGAGVCRGRRGLRVLRALKRRRGGGGAAGLEREGPPPKVAAARQERLPGHAGGAPAKRRREENSAGKGGVTICLFYQYKEPPWTSGEFKAMLQYGRESGARHRLGGRMRVAPEGFNCTLTGPPGCPGIRGWCKEIRERFPDPFANTEFKLTDGLPRNTAWPELEVTPAQELVGYGLAGELAPPVSKGGAHLEPRDYHAKMAEPDTVILDIRNGYEVDIGRMAPPTGGTLINPEMRRSTDFPAWVQRSDVQEKLKNKQVLMYCTGGIRCERASSLLNHHMGGDIKGVFQLQGGIDKYLKEFGSDGGYWVGKNYTFDKRLYHGAAEEPPTEVLGRCILCKAPWEEYLAGLRCASCGVPVLACDACAERRKQQAGEAGLPEGAVRCSLCIKDGVLSKAEFRERERRQNADASREVYRLIHGTDPGKAPSDGGAGGSVASGSRGDVTRLFIGNLSAKRVDEATLLKHFPGITHIQWLKDKSTGLFYGSVFVEMATAEDAAKAVAMDGKDVSLRPVRVKYAPLQGPSRWPPYGSEVGKASTTRPATKHDMKKATAKGQVVPMGPKPFPKCRKFFVRGLPPDAGEQDIRAFFARAGEVEVAGVRWMTDKETGGFRGSALVELANTRQADMAASLHGQKLLGFAARLEWTQ